MIHSPYTCCLIFSKFLRNFHFFIHSNGHANQPSLGLNRGKCIKTNISWLSFLAKNERVVLQKRQNVKTVRVYLVVGKLLRKSPRDGENEDGHSPPQATEKLPEKIKKLEEI